MAGEEHPVPCTADTQPQPSSHYSVVDRWGNAVSITYTVNDYYGSAAAVNGAGFLLNNEMNDFAVKPGVPNLYGLLGGEANAIMVNPKNKVFLIPSDPRNEF